MQSNWNLHGRANAQPLMQTLLPTPAHFPATWSSLAMAAARSIADLPVQRSWRTKSFFTGAMLAFATRGASVAMLSWLPPSWLPGPQRLLGARPLAALAALLFSAS